MLDNSFASQFSTIFSHCMLRVFAALAGGAFAAQAQEQPVSAPSAAPATSTIENHPTPLHEVDPVASMAIRERQWRQMQAYARAKGPTSQIQDAPDFPKLVSPEAVSLRLTLQQRIGYPPPGFHDTVQEHLEKIGEDSLATYYRCTIPVSPEMETYGLYLVPKGAAFPAPLVIAQHGGGGFPELALFRGGGNYHDLVRGPVRHGWVVFAPHLVFYPFGDRDHNTPLPENVRAELDDQLRKRGTTLAAVEVAKITKALDALLKRPENDARRVVMTGLSYGGYYTLYTTALDARIRAAVPSCSFFKGDEVTGNHVAEIRTEGVLRDLEPWELAALICPRPLQVQAGRRDDLLGIEPTTQQATKAAAFYRSQGAADQFEFAPFDGGHEFNGALAWPSTSANSNWRISKA
jgi:dienelactone hydrolase